MRVWYTNYRGEKAIRDITIIKIRYGTSEYHNGTQWFITAIDNERDVVRDFAVLDFGKRIIEDGDDGGW